MKSEDIDNLTKDSLELECTLIEIAQQKPGGLSFKGAGKIRKTAHDGFEFTIYIFEKPSEWENIKFSQELCIQIEPGEIIDESAYFSIIATTIDGEVWKGADIWIEADINHTTGGIIARGSASELKNEDETSNKSFSTVVLAHHQGLKLPANEWTEQNGRKSRNKTSFLINNISYSVIIHSKHLQINAESQEPFSEATIDSFVNSLKIVTGRSIKIFYRFHRDNGIIRRAITAQDLQSPFHRLMPPTKLNSHPRMHPEYHLLLSQLMDKFTGDLNPYFLQYFDDMALSAQAGLEASALGFSVGVEGMIQRYHKKLQKSDTSFIDSCLSAIPEIEKLVSEEKIKAEVAKRLINNLNGSGNPSTKNALYKLFRKEVADKWNNIRHPAAHGTLIDKNLSNQQMIDATNACLYMYYSILFFLLQSECKLIDYSTPGYTAVDNEVRQALKAEEKTTT